MQATLTRIQPKEMVAAISSKEKTKKTRILSQIQTKMLLIWRMAILQIQPPRAADHPMDEIIWQEP